MVERLPAGGEVLLPLLAFLAASYIALAVSRQVGRQRERAQVRRQLRNLATSGVAEAPADELLRRMDDGAGWTHRILRRVPVLQHSDRLLEQAGLDWGAERLVRRMLWVGLGVSAAVMAVTGSPVRALCALGVGGAVPYLRVARQRARRLKAFEEQLPDAIDLLSRAIRAGHTISTALGMVGEESADPLGSEFRRVFEEQRYGLPFEESLIGLARRVAIVDVRVMVVAILVQREVGGNLTEILDKIARLIRTRFSLRRQVRVYTAQGRMSGYVLGVLPVLVGGVIFLLNPEYMRLLVTDPLGRIMLGTAVTMQMVGYLWIWRILKVDL